MNSDSTAYSVVIVAFFVALVSVIVLQVGFYEVRIALLEAENQILGISQGK